MPLRYLITLIALILSVALAGAATRAQWGATEPARVAANHVAAAVPPQPAAAQPAVAPQPAAPVTVPVVWSSRPVAMYMVRSGDTLFAIARRFGMTPADLARLNGIPASEILLPGRTLAVPLPSPIDPRRLANGVGGVAPPPLTAAPTATPPPVGTYTVQPGDTLYALAARFALSADDLRRWNGLTDDSLLQVGHVLSLGDASAASQAEHDNAGPPEGEPTAVAPVTLPESARDQSVVVEPGDTLSSVAERYGTTANTLLRLNDLSGDFLSAGQTLRVPRAGQGPAGLSGPKRIEIDVSEQHMYVWQGETLVWSFTTSTGLPGYVTRRGTFAVQSKVPNAWSTAWQLWMPHWLGIYWAGGSENGIHALPIINGQKLWGGYLGSPISYGCVVLGTDDAEALYNWADMGTPVVIHD